MNSNNPRLIGLSLAPHLIEDDGLGYIPTEAVGSVATLLRILGAATIPAYRESGLDLTSVPILPVYARDGYVWTGPLPVDDVIVAS